MWLEESIGTPINVERAREAIGTGAGVVSTACPYCTVMLDDAVLEEAGAERGRGRRARGPARPFDAPRRRTVSAVMRHGGS